ncbi:unnamed protein product, partial [Sphacelaria rigidula]
MRMHDERLPNIVKREVIIRGKTTAGRPARRLQHGVTEYCSDFGINTTSWTQVAQYPPEWYRIVEDGVNMYMTAWIEASHAKVLCAVTARVPPAPIEDHQNITSRPS